MASHVSATLAALCVAFSKKAFHVPSVKMERCVQSALLARPPARANRIVYCFTCRAPKLTALPLVPDGRHAGILQALTADGTCVDSCPFGTAKVRQGRKPRVMKCVPEHRCVGGLKQGTTTPCECEDGSCRDCTIRRNGTTCWHCDATRFLVNGACVKNALCKGSKINKKGVVTDTPCTCLAAGPSCQSCLQTKVGTTVVTTCVSCKKKFMHMAACLADCPVGYANYGLHSKYGRKW